ncbi:LysR family transcriptional regulator [Paenibacillus sp. PL91]|uniref:LysR family transcriptional regulator n=1 Tax=Paenibacillus sp. PL91 TaxID=2729538 RepID=UPI00145DEB49|nr:LysR family transcriptional regulator [Paenibacillus sp. PL91]MBC9198947.1 LysR family transcriptional regulator [Paenibacillus sp. PL91]
MDTRHIQYFIAVCEHLHFTKAAEYLGISQPTLSQQIRVLEGELGMPLFDRIGKKIVLTEAGELLRLHGGRMIQAEQDAKNAIIELFAGERGSIRLGVLPSDLDFQLVPLFIYFHEKYPAIQLQAFSTIRVQEEVISNKVDIGIGLKSTPDPRLVQLPLGSEPYQLLVSRTSPLANKLEIELQELEHIPLVMYPLGYLGRDLVEAACRELGFSLTTVMETSSATSLLQLVRAGIGATVQPEHLLRGVPQQPDLVPIPITRHTPFRHMELVYRSDRFISQAQKQLGAWLAAFFQNKDDQKLKDISQLAMIHPKQE